MLISKCPYCQSFPEHEQHTFEGIQVHLWACPKECIVPDELKRTDALAREEWERHVENGIDDLAQEKKGEKQ